MLMFFRYVSNYVSCNVNLIRCKWCCCCRWGRSDEFEFLCIEIVLLGIMFIVWRNLWYGVGSVRRFDLLYYDGWNSGKFS